MAERELRVDHSTIGRLVLRYSPELQKRIAAIPGIPTGRGGWMKPISASLGDGPIYIGPWIPPVRPLTSSSLPSAMRSRRSISCKWRCGELAGSDRE